MTLFPVWHWADLALEGVLMPMKTSFHTEESTTITGRPAHARLNHDHRDCQAE